MRVNFTYNTEKDIWCLIQMGKSSINSQNSTKQYNQLITQFGENPTYESTSIFIDEYLAKNQINILKRIEDFKNEWDLVSSEFHTIAKSVFGTSIPKNVTAYLTINSRCPYSIEDNFFYVFIQSKNVRTIVMHELWHFYTWYTLGKDQEEILGKQKYNDIKEALTVLLNVECSNLFPEGVFDIGYPQHQEIREEILKYWGNDKNIINLWNHLLKNMKGC